MVANLTSIVLLSLLTIGAALLVRRILPRIGKLEAIAVGFPLGAAMLTWLMFLLSRLGVPLQRGTIWAVALLLSLVPLWLTRPWPSRDDLRRWLSLRSLGLQLRGDPAFVALILSVVALSGAALYTSIVFSYGSWDAAAIWAAKGYGISLERDIFAGELWGAHGLAYPLNLPLLITTFQSLSGDLLPASKMIFPLYLASAFLAIGAHAMRTVRPKWLVVAIVALFTTTPHVFLHGTIGYADLAHSSYLALGVLWAVEALHNGQRGPYLLSGLLFAFGAWTRPEGIGYVVVLILTLSLAAFLAEGARPRIGLWLLPVVVVMSPWLSISVGSMSGGQIGGALRGFWPELLAGRLNLWELYLIPRLFLDRALDPVQWGVLWPVLVPVFVFSVGRLVPRRYPENFTLAAAVFVSGLIPVGLFYIESYTRSDYQQLITRSFDRALLPAVLMLAYLAMRIFDSVPEERVDDTADEASA